MKKLFLRLFVVLIAFVGLCALVDSKTVNAETVTIKCISTNPAEDCNTSMNINYHLPVGVSGSYVYYTLKSDTNWENKIKVMPEKEFENKAFTQKNAIGSDLVQVNVTLTNLTPGTEYMYKVYCGSVESDTYYFKTGDQYFSFIWTSDFHSYYDDARRLKAATEGIDACLELNGGADFIFSTGDTIAHGGTYQWWEQVSNIHWMKEYMFCSTLGNHDWMTKSGTTVDLGASHNFFSANFNNPKNGYSGQENVCYYFYYGDAIFICLNTEEYSTAQYNWCEEVLKNCDAQYIFMFQHYQAINKAGGFNSSGYTRWHDLCDKYGVDVFFSGNSHVYIRTRSIYKGAENSRGTVYMVAPSSDGERGEDMVDITSNKDLIAKNWAGGSKQVANSIVKVSATGVTIKLINRDGSNLDFVSIPTKRCSSSRISVPLPEDFDKAAFESEISFANNTADLSGPYIRHPENAADYIKWVTVKNKDTGDIYYNEGLVAGKAKSKMANYPIREVVNLEVTYRYVDNSETTYETTFVSRTSYGTFKNLKSSLVDEGLKLTWQENLKETEVDHKEIYVNDELIDEVEIGTIQYIIDLDKLPDNVEAKITVKIVSIINDVIEEFSINYTKVVIIENHTESITITNNNEKITVDDVFNLSASALPVDTVDSILWSVSDNTVVEINEDGSFKALKAGTVTIKAYSSSDETVYAEVEIEVLDKVIEPEPVDPTPVDPTPVDPTPVEPEPVDPEPGVKNGCGSATIINYLWTFMLLGAVIVLRKKH